MANILMILQAILIVLKLLDYIAISWWLVFVPVYVILGLHAVLLIPPLLYVVVKWFRGN